jgi:choline dehydrogenase-like flavoprotein
MGKVVDRDCRSYDHRNLFILGSSVFPSTSAANPTLTIAALALRAGEFIKLELR